MRRDANAVNFCVLSVWHFLIQCVVFYYVFCFQCVFFMFIIPVYLFSAYYVLCIIYNFLFINLPARPFTFPGITTSVRVTEEKQVFCKQRYDYSALHRGLILSDKYPSSLSPRVWAFGGVGCVNTIRESTVSDERYLLDESVALYFII